MRIYYYIFDPLFLNPLFHYTRNGKNLCVHIPYNFYLKTSSTLPIFVSVRVLVLAHKACIYMGIKNKILNKTEQKETD